MKRCNPNVFFGGNFDTQLKLLKWWLNATQFSLCLNFIVACDVPDIIKVKACLHHDIITALPVMHFYGFT